MNKFDISKYTQLKIDYNIIKKEDLEAYKKTRKIIANKTNKSFKQ